MEQAIYSEPAACHRGFLCFPEVLFELKLLLRRLGLASYYVAPPTAQTLRSLMHCVVLYPQTVMASLFPRNYCKTICLAAEEAFRCVAFQVIAEAEAERPEMFRCDDNRCKLHRSTDTVLFINCISKWCTRTWSYLNIPLHINRPRWLTLKNNFLQTRRLLSLMNIRTSSCLSEQKL